MARLIFITQAFDEDDPLLAVAVSWVRALAAESRISSVHVVALRAGRYPAIPHVSVSPIRARTRIGTMIRFYRDIIPRLRGTDAFFVHMGGPYPLWLLSFKLMLGIPVYQWKTHRHVGLMMKFYARFCDTKIFTATPQSFPYHLPNIRVLGHGIDTGFFTMADSVSGRGLAIIGRISPVKRIEIALAALAECHRRGSTLSLDMYGPVFEGDRGYHETLCAAVRRLGLLDTLAWHGPVPQRDLPSLIGNHRVVVSCNDGGLDKAVLEAFSCGVPVITDNPCVAEILPPILRAQCIVPRGDASAYASAIMAIMAMDGVAYRALGQELRAVVVARHSLESLMRGMMKEMAL